MGKYGRLRAMWYFSKLKNIASPFKEVDKDRNDERETGMAAKEKQRRETERVTEKGFRGDIGNTKKIKTDRNNSQSSSDSNNNSCRSRATVILDRFVNKINVQPGSSTQLQLQMESDQVQALSLEYCRAHSTQHPQPDIPLATSSSSSTSQLNIASHQKTSSGGGAGGGGGGGMYYQDICNRRQKILDNEERSPAPTEISSPSPL